MSRPLRIEFPGALYHVTTRGNGRADIFVDDIDRDGFLAVLSGVVARWRWLCHAYCLMGNHYHLVVGTPEANLSRGMRQLNGVYTQRFNRRHDSVGHVFQGRYGAILVERDAHLLELSRYLVLNPVRAGMVRAAKDWRWSSYRAMVGQAKAPDWLSTDWILAQFGADEARARSAYRRFVAEGAGAASPWQGLRGDGVLGGEAFRAEVADRMPAAGGEVPRLQRHLARPALSSLGQSTQKRDQWMTTAYREHGYLLTEIAACAGLHYSSVSKIIKAWEEEKNSRFKT